MIKIVGAGATFVLLVIVLVGAGATSVIAAVFGGGTSTPSPMAVNDIPPDYLARYRQAATTCAGLGWSVLAAIGKVETDHGRSSLPGVHSGSNYAGAKGPMQFEPATFAQYGNPVPPGGASPPSPYDPTDAIYAAARMLCANGAGRGDLQSTIFAYNHSTAYVRQVLAQAHQYAQDTPVPSVTCGSAQLGDGSTSGSAALRAIAFACAQMGKPYVWGGNGSPGFDCSGLTHAAYAAAGVAIPRTAQTQYNEGPVLPAGASLQAGDLVFYGAGTDAVTHVGLAISATQMIDAPHTGANVRIDGVGRYLAASRPFIGSSAAR